MSLPLLLTLVIGGIAGIGAVLHLVGLSRTFQLTPEVAQAQWHRHFPNDTVRAVSCAQSGAAALVETGGGLGVLWAFGADTVGRRLPAKEVHVVPRGLRLHFDDITAPRVLLQLTDEEARDWAHRIRAEKKEQSA